ncbi:hypothetical protein GCM10017600_10440 [Streptosporangium carneum]|uniref:Uncharacterized protein n=2 Tax=Streptosporangium carneum TaxID=47481 RepID=A0A9W6HYC2_9ACTN|nr:hypothetical protein GCM10017600_10440 [Streptosporangium carneum]
MGIARLALVGLAVLALVALIVAGVLALFGSLGSEPEPRPSPTPTAAVSSASPERVPTVLVQCLRERCPTVFLRVAGGDVLLNREMVRDEQARFFEDKIDVVLADSASVRVRVNGVERSPGGPGERQEFTASRE